MQKRYTSTSGDFEDSFSSVPHASGLRLMFTDHIDISQAFVQGDLLPGDGHNGKVYISAPPGYPEDPDICYLLRKPLYGMQSAGRTWHATMSVFLKSKGCTKVAMKKACGYLQRPSKACCYLQRSSNSAPVHIDDIIISCAHRPTLDRFRNALLARFDDTRDGVIQTYLGCEIECDMLAGTTVLSQKHYAEDILPTYGFWGCLPLATLLPPHTRLSNDDCDPAPERVYHGIVGSLGYLVNMTRPDLVFAYSELSKYVQRSGKAHMVATEYTLRYLLGTFDKSLRFSRDCPIVDTPWGWVDSDWVGDTDARLLACIAMSTNPVRRKSTRHIDIRLYWCHAPYSASHPPHGCRRPH